MNADAIRIARILAHNLRFERQERKLTQEQTAKKAKVSLRQLQKLELGQANATIDTLCCLAQVFETTVDRLIHVGRIRTPLSESEFRAAFENKFRDSELAAGLRTLQGLVLWGNAATTSLGIPIPGAKPVDLAKVLQGPALGLLKAQLACEQRGITTPYTNYYSDPASGKNVFLRYYPTLIFPLAGSKPYFAALYLIAPENDTEAGYYKFCDRLLGVSG